MIDELIVLIVFLMIFLGGLLLAGAIYAAGAFILRIFDPSEDERMDVWR